MDWADDSNGLKLIGGMDVEEGFSAINEAYKIWKKHSPFLYSLLQSYELGSCTQSVDWFAESYLENDWRISTLLTGTNALTHNALQLLTVATPTDDAATDFAAYREERPELPPATNGYVGTLGQQQVTVRLTIPQASEVMKARINRFDENLLAVRTGGATPECLVYDLRNKEDELEARAVKLEGHAEEGFGLAWSPHEAPLLLSAAYDRRLLLFNAERATAEAKWECSDGVEDAKWSAFNRNLAATAQCDEKVCLWDTRVGEEKAAVTRRAHAGQVYAVDFNRRSEFLLVSGGEDGDVNLWDVRNMAKKLHSFLGHNDAVNSIAWSPTSPTRFASASSDRRVVLWDLERLADNTPDRPGNEIVFIHGGHRSKVTDLSWSSEKGVLASAEEGNSLQVWRMTDSIK